MEYIIETHSRRQRQQTKMIHSVGLVVIYLGTTSQLESRIETEFRKKKTQNLMLKHPGKCVSIGPDSADLSLGTVFFRIRENDITKKIRGDSEAVEFSIR